jgi:cytidylate kinase
MVYTVIAIARTLGAGGEAIGRMVAGDFGMRYVDSEIIDEAATLVGVTEKDLAKAEIGASKGLIERIIESFALGGAASEIPATRPVSALPGYEKVIIDVIRRTASEGNAVIVAHGAAIALAGSEGVLRVLVTASPQTRKERLMALGQGKTTAQRLVEESDASRAEFLRRFYQHEAEVPTDYDLVINTDHLSADEAAALIRGLVERAKK